MLTVSHGNHNKVMLNNFNRRMGDFSRGPSRFAREKPLLREKMA